MNPQTTGRFPRGTPEVKAVDETRECPVTPQTTMEHYRCFHCKQVFGPEIAQDHFGKHTTDLPKCIQYVRNGSGGGPHDAYIRVRKDEFGKILATLDLAKGQMGGRHSDADLHAIVQVVIDAWQWIPREPIKDPAL